jgi:acyl carrier protein
MKEIPRMDHAEVLEKVIAIISDQIAVGVDDIDESTALEDDLDVDSLDLLQIVTAIEDEFNITVEDEAFETVRTVGDAVAYIEELV